MSETQRQIRPQQTETVPEARMSSAAPPTADEAEDKDNALFDAIDEMLEGSQDLWKHYRQKGGQ